ncbi:hypothetical protein Bbelb_276870 [Branchiostoma belcheri]|nr:hypothetical protein Bbelb_276870 [Branchiostoma belcheri]
MYRSLRGRSTTHYMALLTHKLLQPADKPGHLEVTLRSQGRQLEVTWGKPKTHLGGTWKSPSKSHFKITCGTPGDHLDVSLGHLKHTRRYLNTLKSPGGYLKVNWEHLKVIWRTYGIQLGDTWKSPGRYMKTPGCYLWGTPKNKQKDTRNSPGSHLGDSLKSQGGQLEVT